MEKSFCYDARKSEGGMEGKRAKDGGEKNNLSHKVCISFQGEAFQGEAWHSLLTLTAVIHVHAEENRPLLHKRQIWVSRESVGIGVAVNDTIPQCTSTINQS